MPGVDHTKIPETLRKITPRYGRTIAIQHSLDEQPVINRRLPYMPFATRQKILDPIPLVVPQSIAFHHLPADLLPVFKPLIS